MSRPQLIDDETLLNRLSDSFRDKGYDGVSIADLSAVTGLKKPSLYHRFPNGKEQMAGEVLAHAISQYEALVIAPLESQRPLPARIKLMNKNLAVFYGNGKKGCLLNALASAGGDIPSLGSQVAVAMEAWSGALAAAFEESGWTKAAAKKESLLVVSLVEGSLVVCRALNTTNAFSAALDQIVQMAQKKS